jgi:hypothetical protein
MVAIPEPSNTALNAVNAAIEAEQSRAPGRYHLGASIIGDECERKLWYTFRWAHAVLHDARLLRLFNRGQLEENRFNYWLKSAGFQVWDVDPDTNDQWRIEDIGGHFGGSLDGVVMGLPEAPSKPHVSEQKTHNDKSFKDVEKKGVRESKPQHYAQMQVYMHKMELQRALYQAINKNNDELYFERVNYDKEYAERLIKKAERIIASDRPRERISQDPSWYQCKFCDFHPVCHGRKAPAMNCRTCVHSTPRMDGNARWVCEKHDKDLSGEDQKLGCDDHNFIPPMLEHWATPTDSDEHNVHYTNTLNGKPFVNGPGGYKSSEIAAVVDVSIIGDDTTEMLKEEFPGAELVG